MQQVSELLKSDLSAAAAAAALGLAFVMGAVHALSPGHGKTLVAAYLAGTRGTMKHAFILGASVTVTHTISVFALGFATLFLTRYFLPQQLAQILSVASGLSIVAFGGWLLRKRIRRLRHTHSHGHDHRHHHHHGPEDASLGALLALGAGGGLTPCPSALVLMLSAISLGRVALGLALLAAFSVGLAAVLIAVGGTVLYARRFVPANLPRVSWIPVASAAVIVAAGIAMTATALRP